MSKCSLKGNLSYTQYERNLEWFKKLAYFCFMPTILRINGFRFFFYTNEHSPIHIHVEKDSKTAKFNLEIVELVKSRGFNASELKEIRKLVNNNVELFKNKWNEYFNN